SLACCRARTSASCSSRWRDERRQAGGAMKVNGVAMRSIWREVDGWSVGIIDQTRLPHALVIDRLTSLAEAAEAIRAMRVRGAPLIGAAAAYGICLALRADPSDAALDGACEALAATRPTAINLRWAIEDMRARLAALPPERRVAAAYARADAICEEDIAINRSIGIHGMPLIAERWEAKGRRVPVEVLTH